ncbi:syntenin-2-like [Manis javanica]|uniref:syntenin-2-like n=1 Tax=Manis javanica TaxID=9974 RepID=UPI003C6CDE89
MWSCILVPCRLPEDQQESDSFEEDLGLVGRGLTVGSCLLQGLFVQLVQANTPASLVGLRFGDQILQIDGRDCAGWSTAKAHRAVKKASAEKIVMVVRDRPFQRTVTMHKDSMGHVGFVIKKGKVTSEVKRSSAAHNGLLTNHSVCEVNGQNVIGLKDKEVTGILATAGNVITLTIIPTVIYEHMIKKVAGGSGHVKVLEVEVQAPVWCTSWWAGEEKLLPVLMTVVPASRLSPALLHHTMDHSMPDV